MFFSAKHLFIRTCILNTVVNVVGCSGGGGGSVDVEGDERGRYGFTICKSSHLRIHCTHIGYTIWHTPL